MKFRKKPVVIEAEQWDGTDGEAERLGLYFVSGSLVGITRGWFIRTLEGPLYCKSLDWIITGVKGEKYPCKPDIFEQTYEPVKATLMTEQTGDKIADSRWALVKRLMLAAPKTRHKEGRIASVRAGIIIDRLLEVKVAGVPLSELIRRVEGGRDEN